MFGIKVPRSDKNYEEFAYFFNHLHDQAQKYDMMIGIPSFIALVVCQKLRAIVRPKINEAFHRAKARGDTRTVWLLQFTRLAITLSTLLIIVITTFIASRLIKQGIKVKVVGNVPAGFNSFHVSSSSSSSS